MGRLLRIEPCPVCNYYIEDVLFWGGSTRTRLFIYNRYALAKCNDCNDIVSVLVPAPEPDLAHMLDAARRDIATLEARTARGDTIARRLLVLHRLALEADGDVGGDTELQVCTLCGSHNVTLYPEPGGDSGEHYDDGTAWIACPRCEEGELLLYTAGEWDEIDSGL